MLRIHLTVYGALASTAGFLIVLYHFQALSAPSQVANKLDTGATSIEKYTDDAMNWLESNYTEDKNAIRDPIPRDP